MTFTPDELRQQFNDRKLQLKQKIEIDIGGAIAELKSGLSEAKKVELVPLLQLAITCDEAARHLVTESRFDLDQGVMVPPPHDEPLRRAIIEKLGAEGDDAYMPLYQLRHFYFLNKNEPFTYADTVRGRCYSARLFPTDCRSSGSTLEKQALYDDIGSLVQQLVASVLNKHISAEQQLQQETPEAQQLRQEAERKEKAAEEAASARSYAGLTLMERLNQVRLPLRHQHMTDDKKRALLKAQFLNVIPDGAGESLDTRSFSSLELKALGEAMEDKLAKRPGLTAMQYRLLYPTQKFAMAMRTSTQLSFDQADGMNRFQAYAMIMRTNDQLCYTQLMELSKEQQMVLAQRSDISYEEISPLNKLQAEALIKDPQLSCEQALQLGNKRQRVGSAGQGMGR
jgi:hypothetical protein